MATRQRRGTAGLATAALRRLDEELPWYRALDAEDRSWVGLVAQAGISAFTSWFEHPGEPLGITADVFGTAPRELTRSISLSQTLELVRTVVEVVEDHVDELTDDPGDPAQAAAVREAVLRYSREVAFAAAEVYARAAETRGAWDARLEALVVDALLRGETDDALHSRVAALGWNAARGRRRGRRARPAEQRTDTSSTTCAARRARPPTTPWSASRAAGWWCCSARPATPRRPPTNLRRGSVPARWWSGRRPPTSPAPAARRASRSPGSWPPGRGRPRRVRCTPTTCCPSGCCPATSPRAARWSTASTRRCVAAGAAFAGDRRRLPRAGPLAGGDRPHAVRAPQHGALPAAPGRRGAPAGTPPGPATPSCCRPRWPVGLLANRRHPTAVSVCRNPPHPTQRCAVRDRHRGRGHGRVDTCWSSSAPARGPRAPASSPHGSSCPGFARAPRLAGYAVAGLDLVAHGTTSDADTIRDTAVAQPLIVAAGLVSLLGSVPPSRRRVRRDRRWRRPQRRRDHRGRRSRRAQRRAGDGASSASAVARWPRRSAVTPTGMSAVVGRRPRRGARRARAARPDPRERQRRRPGRRRRHPGAARCPRRPTRRPRRA